MGVRGCVCKDLRFHAKWRGRQAGVCVFVSDGKEKVSIWDSLCFVCVVRSVHVGFRWMCACVCIWWWEGLECISGPRWVSSTNYCTLHICCHPTEHRVCWGTVPTHTHTNITKKHRSGSNKNFTNSLKLLPSPAIPINLYLIFCVSHVYFFSLLPSSFFPHSPSILFSLLDLNCYLSAENRPWCSSAAASIRHPSTHPAFSFSNFSSCSILLSCPLCCKRWPPPRVSYWGIWSVLALLPILVPCYCLLPSLYGILRCSNPTYPPFSTALLPSTTELVKLYIFSLIFGFLSFFFFHSMLLFIYTHFPFFSHSFPLTTILPFCFCSLHNIPLSLLSYQWW